MQGKLMMAPWMRRRIARHVERGTSERVLACLLGTNPTEPAPNDQPDTRATGPGADRPDVSNVILFRALNNAVGHSAAGAS
ncbi:hypothetical protein MKK58_11185 [Methylobacterium sp. J-078]|nr:hypothetical protein [Methylobacterium sp. J-078]